MSRMSIKVLSEQVTDSDRKGAVVASVHLLVYLYGGGDVVVQSVILACTVASFCRARHSCVVFRQSTRSVCGCGFVWRVSQKGVTPSPIISTISLLGLLGKIGSRDNVSANEIRLNNSCISRRRRRILGVYPQHTRFQREKITWPRNNKKRGK